MNSQKAFFVLAILIICFSLPVSSQAAKKALFETVTIANAGSFSKDISTLTKQMADTEARLAQINKELKVARAAETKLSKSVADIPWYRPLQNRKLTKTYNDAKNSVKTLEAAKTALEDSRKAIRAAADAISAEVKAGKTGILKRALFKFKNANVFKNVTSLEKNAGKVAGKALAKVSGKAVVKTSSKGIIKTIVTSPAFYIELGTSLGITILPHIYAEEDVPPSVLVNKEAPNMIQINDGKTKVFFQTEINPNSELSIGKVVKLRKYWEENQGWAAQAAEWIGTGGAVEAGDAWRAWGLREDSEYLVGCDMELYKLNSNNEREELVATANTFPCQIGRINGQVWTIHKELEPANYELVFYTHFDKGLIYYNQDAIKNSGIASYYTDLLQGVNVDPEILKAIKEKQNITLDPLIAKIMAGGMPFSERITLTPENTGISTTQANRFLIKNFEVFSSSTKTKKNSFKLSELNQIELRFDFLRRAENILITVNEKGSTEDPIPIVTDFFPISAWPNGNPYFIQQGMQYYVLNVLSDAKIAQGQNPSEGRFEEFKKAITKPGVFEVKLFILQDVDAEEITPVAVEEITIKSDSIRPETQEVLTTGTLELLVGNKTQIESFGVSLENYVNSLRVKTVDGKIVASPTGDDGSRIYLKGDKIVIENITKSNIKEITYILEIAVPGREINRGSIIIGANAEEVK